MVVELSSLAAQDNSEVECYWHKPEKMEEDKILLVLHHMHSVVELEMEVVDNWVVGWGYHTVLAVVVDQSMENFAVKGSTEDSLVDLVVVVRIHWVVELILEVDIHLVEDHNYSQW